MASDISVLLLCKASQVRGDHPTITRPGKDGILFTLPYVNLTITYLTVTFQVLPFVATRLSSEVVTALVGDAIPHEELYE